MRYFEFVNMDIKIKGFILESDMNILKLWNGFCFYHIENDMQMYFTWNTSLFDKRESA